MSPACNFKNAIHNLTLNWIANTRVDWMPINRFIIVPIYVVDISLVFDYFVVSSLGSAVSLFVGNDKLFDPLWASNSNAARRNHSYRVSMLIR